MSSIPFIELLVVYKKCLAISRNIKSLFDHVEGISANKW